MLAAVYSSPLSPPPPPLSVYQEVERVGFIGGHRIRAVRGGPSAEQCCGSAWPSNAHNRRWTRCSIACQAQYTLYHPHQLRLLVSSWLAWNSFCDQASRLTYFISLQRNLGAISITSSSPTHEAAASPPRQDAVLPRNVDQGMLTSQETPWGRKLTSISLNPNHPEQRA